MQRVWAISLVLSLILSTASYEVFVFKCRYRSTSTASSSQIWHHHSPSVWGAKHPRDSSHLKIGNWKCLKKLSREENLWLLWEWKPSLEDGRAVVIQQPWGKSEIVSVSHIFIYVLRDHLIQLVESAPFWLVLQQKMGSLDSTATLDQMPFCPAGH